MNRPNTRSGLFSAIGAASSYKDQYYYGTDTGIYYYSNGTVWNTSNFDESNTVNNLSDTTVANTPKVLVAANPARKWLYFQNNGNTASMYIGLGYVPTATNGILVVKDGGYVRFDSYVPTDAVHVLCTHAHAYTCLEGL